MAADFTPRQIGRLAEMISRRFASEEMLKRAVVLGLNSSLDNYSLAPNLISRILELCEIVNTQGRVSELIDGLKLANPNPQLALELDGFLRAGSATNVCGILLVTELPPLPVINRRDLRSYLGQIMTPASAYHVLSISGPSACGKTHSKELIIYVAKSIGVTPLHVNVMVDDTKPRTLRQVLEKIALGVQRPFNEFTALVSDQPTDAQVAERFVSWFSGLSQNFGIGGNRYWITFDGLDRPAAEPTRELLIPLLLRAVADGNLENVKLFLLGDNGKRIREARGIVLHEEASSLTEADIRNFVVEYAAARGWQLSENQLKIAMKFIIGKAVWPFDHPAMEGIRDRLEKVLAVIDSPGQSLAELLQGLQ